MNTTPEKKLPPTVPIPSTVKAIPPAGSNWAHDDGKGFNVVLDTVP